MVVAAALSAERLPAPSTRGSRASMALSFALHGLALAPLLLAGLSAGAPSDEPAFLVELMLAAPAPATQTEPNASELALLQPSPLIETKAEPEAEPEIAVELPPPDEPPPLDTADLKPIEPPKPVEPPKPPPPKPKAQAKPAPAQRAKAATVTQTSSAPNTGDAEATQTMAAAQHPLIIFEGKPRFRVPPRPAVYPPRAIELGQQGEALVRVRLEPDGSAAEIVLWRGSGFELLDRAALHAVRGWHFLPAMRGGRAVAAWVEIPVRFHLH